MKRIKVILLIYLIILGIITSSSAVDKSIKGVKRSSSAPDDISEKKKELDIIRRQIEVKKKKLMEVKKKKEAVLSEIRNIEKKIARMEKERNVLESRLNRTNRRIMDTERRIEKLQGAISFYTNVTSGRITMLYKISSSYNACVPVSWEDFYENARIKKYLVSIIHSDIANLRNYQSNLDEYNRLKGRLEIEKRKYVELKRRIEEKKDNIVQEKEKRKKLLASIREKEVSYSISIKELNESSKRIMDFIRRREREIERAKVRPPEGKGFPFMKGKLPLPVNGRIVGFYGKRKDPEYNTYTFHRGIDIEAPEGAEIRAVYDGRIIYSDWLKGYGNIIIIDHGDGYYTVYAHVSKIFRSVGENVKGGDVIALVGETGSIKGSYLYFEIRYHGATVNPMEWLATKN